MELFEIQEADRTKWDEFVDGSDHGHPLQLWGWGEVKKVNGWSAVRLVDSKYQNGVQILLKKIPKTKFKLAYVARGPVCHPDNLGELLDSALKYLKKQKGVLSLRVELDLGKNMVLNWGKSKFNKTKNHVQMAETLMLDLNKSEEDILANMSKSTRKTLRRADRVVEVRKISDIDAAMEAFERIYSYTAENAKFAKQNSNYYRSILKNLGENIDVYAAFDADRRNTDPVAFSWLFYTKVKAWQLYGGTSPEGKHLNANYALKWTAITESKDADRKMYDFNGRLDGGVADFKRKFGPQEVDLYPTMITYLSPLGRVFEKIELVTRILKRLR